MRHIISRQNPEIKRIYALRLAKERIRQKRFIAEGKRACKTLINSPIKPETIYVTEKYKEYFSMSVDENIICLVSPHVMEKISQSAEPSGILGVFIIPDEQPKDHLLSGLVLAQINDPGNMGTLIRTAAAMNIQSVVIVGGVDPWSFKVVQSSAGFIAYVNIFKLSWQNLIEHAKSYNIPCAALVVSGGQNAKTLCNRHALLVVGNEAHGIPEDWLANCNTQITLSMPGKTESLNAAIAGSIALYIAFSHNS